LEREMAMEGERSTQTEVCGFQDKQVSIVKPAIEKREGGERKTHSQELNHRREKSQKRKESR